MADRLTLTCPNWLFTLLKKTSNRWSQTITGSKLEVKSSDISWIELNDSASNATNKQHTCDNESALDKI